MKSSASTSECTCSRNEPSTSRHVAETKCREKILTLGCCSSGEPWDSCSMPRGAIRSQGGSQGGAGEGVSTVASSPPPRPADPDARSSSVVSTTLVLKIDPTRTSFPHLVDATTLQTRRTETISGRSLLYMTWCSLFMWQVTS